MKSVEVLLRDHVPALGKCGDVVKVAAGYARNYLLPRNIAVQATEENRRTMMRRRVHLDVEEAAHAAEIETRVAALSGREFKTTQKADENGHLYGSVSAGGVAGLLVQAGFEIDERHIRMDVPIKAVGTHPVKIHVHGDHYAEVSVVVEGEEPA